MSRDRAPANHIVRASELPAEATMHLSQPLNENSELIMTRLSDPTGLTHLGVSLARVPPGKESFALHVHSIQEEWVYVLSGRGSVRIDDTELPIGPGDFLGFPPKGPAHLICNGGDEDLVFLQGGDRRPGDRVRFPEHGRIAFEAEGGTMAFALEAELERRPFSDWLAKK